MALLQKRVCDWHEGEEVQAETVTFGGDDGNNYELDLCEKHRAEFGELMARLRKGARVIPMTAGLPAPKATKRTPTVSHGQQGASAVDAKAVRAWARTQKGLTVPDRGRVPQRVIDQFVAAHS